MSIPLIQTGFPKADEEHKYSSSQASDGPRSQPVGLSDQRQVQSVPYPDGLRRPRDPHEVPSVPSVVNADAQDLQRQNQHPSPRSPGSLRNRHPSITIPSQEEAMRDRALANHLLGPTPPTRDSGSSSSPQTPAGAVEAARTRRVPNSPDEKSFRGQHPLIAIPSHQEVMQGRAFANHLYGPTPPAPSASSSAPPTPNPDEKLPPRHSRPNPDPNR